MFRPQCMHCLKSVNKIYNFNGIGYTFNRVITTRKSQNVYETKMSFCTNVKVPPDVLKSRANEFSGMKSSVFESEQVQCILQRMTSMNLDKIYTKRKEDLTNPIYKVLDDKELRHDVETITGDGKERLKMPEVRSLRKPIDVILSRDTNLIHNDEDGANYIFTDISPSEDVRTRAVLVRENSTGILREGSWDERDRMQFMYWPKEGQTYEIAPMLFDENLPFMFEQLRHKDVLDFINVQCEVDSPDYHRVVHSVYEDILTREAIHILKSTRYYGGMMFYYATNEKTFTVFATLVYNGEIDDAADLVKLNSLIHSDTKCSDGLSNEEIVREYIRSNGLTHLLVYLDGESESASQ